MFAMPLIALLSMTDPELTMGTESSKVNPSEADIAVSTQDGRVEGDRFRIQIPMNDSVEKYIEHFRTDGKNTYQQWLDNSAFYLPVIREIFRSETLPEELAYVAMIESGFNPTAVSPAMATGMWQLMRHTGRQYGLKIDWWVDERKDLIKSTRAAARHLRELHDRFQSWPLVLAAYNAGRGKVLRAIARTPSTDFWDLRESEHIYRETKSFVPKFMAAALIARNPEAYGFRIPDPASLRYDEVEILESMDLSLAAFYTGSTFRTIKRLNPAIIGRYTPPDVPGYVLKIPEGTRSMFIAGSIAVRKAALQLQVGEKGEASLLQPIKQRGFWIGHDPCSIAGRKKETERTELPVRFWTAVRDDHGANNRNRGMREKIMAACVFEEKNPLAPAIRQ